MSGNDQTKPERTAALRKLVAGDEPADRAREAMARLAQLLARLLGTTGVATIVDRAVVLAGARFPWLATPRSEGKTLDAVLAALHEGLAGQSPAEARDGFAAVAAALVELLERLIGAGLVNRLLEDAWPDAFGPAEKDAP